MASGISVNFTFLNSDEWQAAADEMIDRANEVNRTFVAVDGAEVLVKNIREHSPKRTGANAASVGVGSVEATGPGTWTAQIGPRTAYGRRLGLGFKGTDSAGRTYTHDFGKNYVESGINDSTGELSDLYEKSVAAALEL